MELLSTYSVKRIDTNTYELTFDYPDNCTAVVTEKGGVYSITIFLKKGETNPSSNYISETIICKEFDGCIEIQFIQQNIDENGEYGVKTATKPSIKIHTNG